MRGWIPSPIWSKPHGLVVHMIWWYELKCRPPCNFTPPHADRPTVSAQNFAKAARISSFELELVVVIAIATALALHVA